MIAEKAVCCSCGGESEGEDEEEDDEDDCCAFLLEAEVLIRAQRTQDEARRGAVERRVGVVTVVKEGERRWDGANLASSRFVSCVGAQSDSCEHQPSSFERYGGGNCEACGWMMCAEIRCWCGNFWRSELGKSGVAERHRTRPRRKHSGVMQHNSKAYLFKSNHHSHRQQVKAQVAQIQFQCIPNSTMYHNRKWQSTNPVREQSHITISTVQKTP